MLRIDTKPLGAPILASGGCGGADRIMIQEEQKSCHPHGLTRAGLTGSHVTQVSAIFLLEFRVG